MRLLDESTNSVNLTAMLQMQGTFHRRQRDASVFPSVRIVGGMLIPLYDALHWSLYLIAVRSVRT